jgi:hypothetical protein
MISAVMIHVPTCDIAIGEGLPINNITLSKNQTAINCLYSTQFCNAFVFA